MKKVLVLFLLSFGVWVVVTWAFDPLGLGLGLVVAFFVTLATRRLELDDAGLLLLPHRLFWALLYVPVLLAYVVRANLDVAYRVLHPALPIRPGIVRAKTSLRSVSGRVLLANSITLTPGTLSVEIKGEYLYIHWVDAKSTDIEQATQEIVWGFEKYLEVMYG